MDISWIQVLLICIITTIGILDQFATQMGFYSPLFSGTLTGLIMGDVTTGLTVGATLQLMSLGMAHYGGATIPDYYSASILGTAYAIMSGMGADYGIGLAIPVALLLTQLDILARMSHSFSQHGMDNAIETLNYKKINGWHIFGACTWALSRVLPVFIGLVFGETVITFINSWLPSWLMSGLKAAGKILPALGIAILLRYLPLKQGFAYFILGFVLIAYFGSMISILGVALVGLALALLKWSQIKSPAVETGPAGSSDDEVEIDE